MRKSGSISGDKNNLYVSIVLLRCPAFKKKLGKKKIEKKKLGGKERGKITPLPPALNFSQTLMLTIKKHRVSSSVLLEVSKST